MQIGCVLVPRFAVCVEMATRLELRGQKLLLVDHRDGHAVVLDATEQSGVQPGTPLQEAMARCKDAALVDANPHLYEAEFEKMLSALESVSPIVEDAGLGCAYVSLCGLEKLYRGNARLVTALLSKINPLFEPRAGIGPGKFPALAAANTAAPHGAVMAGDNVRKFLAPFPVELLPVPWEVRTRLIGFGLKTLHDVAQAGIGPMQAQFGPDGWLAWQLASGTDPRRIVPRKTKDEIVESLALPAPTDNLSTILMACEMLTDRAFRQPLIRGRAARVVTIKGEAGPTLWRRKKIPPNPVGDKEAAFALLKRALDNITLPGPLDTLTIELSALVGDVGRQESMLPAVRATEQIRLAIRQAEAKLGGPAPIYAVHGVKPCSRIPEERSVLVRLSG